MEQSDMVPLAPTRLKKKQGEAIATMVTDDLVVGPPKAKVGRPKKNMMTIDAKIFGHKPILTFLSKRQ